jgi:hypothetical protein
MLTKCPYTLKPLTELAESSREHVILDALGGPDGYSVVACRTENNQLGETVDAAFLKEPLVQILASNVGVKTRSGVAAWTMTGELVDGNRPVEVTIPHQGVAEVFHQKPVVKNASDNSFQIIAPPAQADKILKEMKKNLAKKGISISEPIVRQTTDQTIHSKLTTNFTVLNAGLMKIAYLACCELLGDGFLDDPLNPEWQKAIRALAAEDADKVRLRAFCPTAAADAAKGFLPNCAEHEHIIAIANTGRQGLWVAVRLFGCELLTVVAQASKSNVHELPSGRAELLLCDARGGAIRRKQIIVEGTEK